LSFFVSQTLAQTIHLTYCDDFPKNFYAKNYTTIHIESGQGYCESPYKVLDKRIANFKKLNHLSYINEYYEDNKYVPLPKEVTQLKSLETLKTNAFDGAVFEIENLKVLHLIYGATYKSQLANSFEKLQKLEKLYLSFAHLDSTVTLVGVANLPNLKEVELDHPTQKIVDEVLKNPNITSLKISRAYDVVFDFNNAKYLTRLDLNNNGLIEIPKSIYALTNLQSMVLSDNKIDKIDPEIANLKQLKVFSIYQNRLSELPDELLQCKLLDYLYLDYNRSLASLPADIGELKNLKDLTASQCILTQIPKSLEQCTDLRMLVLHHNKLSSIDLDFGQFPLLVNIKVNDNKLTSVPTSLFELPLVDEIELSNNQLTSVPTSIGKMLNLTTFRVSDNQLKQLPSDIGNLPLLEHLSAWNNQLIDLPESIGNAKNLMYLYVGNNSIITIPSSIKHLKELQALEIQANPLAIFPVEVYHLPKLDRMWVSQSHTKLKGYKPSDKNPHIIVSDKEVKEDGFGTWK
jgi:Leucine-rich repeat (LRR) protein